jgi:hypothetical protein
MGMYVEFRRANVTFFSVANTSTCAGSRSEFTVCVVCADVQQKGEDCHSPRITDGAKGRNRSVGGGRGIRLQGRA